MRKIITQDYTATDKILQGVPVPAMEQADRSDKTLK